MTKKPAAKKLGVKQAPQFAPAVAALPTQPVIANPDVGSFTYRGNIAEGDIRLNAVMNSMNSEGEKLVVMAEEAGNPYTLRRPTGIVELDVHLAGGFPAGGCSMLSGGDNVGKSWLLWRTMAFQQRLFGNSCRLAVALSEGAMPYDQMLRAGMLVRVPDDILMQWQEWRRIRNIPLMTPEEMQLYKRQYGEIYVIRGSTGEEILTGVLRFVETNAVSIIGCDSVSGLLPVANAAKELDDNLKRAAHANMITQFWSKYIPLTTGLRGVNQTTLLFTQQLRANQERANAPAHIQQYLPESVTKGAGATKHYKLNDILLKEAGLIKQGNQETGKEVIGKKVRWDFDKGKAGSHDNQQGEYMYYYALAGTDDAGDLIVAGMRRNIIQKHGSKIYVVQSDTGQAIESMTMNTEKALRERLQMDFEFNLTLRNEIMAFHKIQCVYR